MLGKITGESVLGCHAVSLYCAGVSENAGRASLCAQAAQRAGTIPWDQLWDVFVVFHVGPSFPGFPI